MGRRGRSKYAGNLAKVQNLRKVFNSPSMKHEDGKYYHIYNRGANKQKIFYSDENYFYCLHLLEKYRIQYAVSVIAYCLMPNHCHLLLRQNAGGSISRYVQTTFNAYTQALNKVAGRSGTLFQGRAKSIEITTDEYAIRLCRYIHYNPVASKLAVNASEWNYSDYNEWITDGKPSIKNSNALKVDFTLRDGYFNSGDGYKKFSEEYAEGGLPSESLFDEE